MTPGVRTIIYPVEDIAKAKAVFAALHGVEPTIDEPYYVGFDIGDQHVGLDPHGHSKGMSGPVGYWHVEDIEASLASLLAAGAEMQQEAKGVGGGKLIASVADADGNLIGLIQPVP